MRIIRTVGDIKALIADLPDEMPVEGIEEESPVMFVCEFDDIPSPKPPPTLVIEL